MTIRLAAVGFVTLLAQVVLLREVVVASFGVELIYILAIGVQLLGTAAGVAISRRDASRPDARLAAMFLAFAALVPLLVVVARAFRSLVHGTPGAYLPLPHQLAGIAIVLVPSGALGGALFSHAARACVAGSKTLASAYAVESAGGLAGGLASTILIAAGVQNFTAALLCGLAAVMAAILSASRERPRWLLPAAGAIAVALSAALLVAGTIDLRLTAINHPRVIESLDTPYGRATITRSSRQVVVFDNDAMVFESEGTSAEELVHVAALQVEKVGSVLVFGGAIEGLIPELLKHRPSMWRDVELDRRMVRAASAALASTAPLPRENLTFEDPRRFIGRPGRYDLILSAMPEPQSGQSSRFYTKEFFKQCARRLTPDGVFAFRLASSENLWTPALARRTASIDRALREAFTDVVILPGTSNVILASNRRLTRDPDVLAARMIARGINARLVSPPYLRYLYTNDRRGQIESELAATPAPANSDARPVCYQYTLVLWLSRFAPSVASIDLPSVTLAAAKRWAWAAVALLALSLMLIRRSSNARRVVLVAFAGFAGMILEGALILGYQMTRGALYQDLGLLIALFMAGLAAGSWGVDRLRHSKGTTPRQGVALLVGLVILACLTSGALRFSSDAGLAGTAVLVILAGLLTGGLFGYGALRDVGSQSGVVAPLYAADLIGGCAGSLAGSLFLLPVVGLPGTVLLVAGLALAALAVA